MTEKKERGTAEQPPQPQTDVFDTGDPPGTEASSPRHSATTPAEYEAQIRVLTDELRRLRVTNRNLIDLNEALTANELRIREEKEREQLLKQHMYDECEALGGQIESIASEFHDLTQSALIHAEELAGRDASIAGLEAALQNAQSQLEAKEEDRQRIIAIDAEKRATISSLIDQLYHSELQVDMANERRESEFWQRLAENAADVWAPLRHPVNAFRWLTTVPERLRIFMIVATVCALVSIIGFVLLASFALTQQRRIDEIAVASTRLEREVEVLQQTNARAASLLSGEAVDTTYTVEEMDHLTRRVNDAGQRCAYLLEDRGGVAGSVVPRGKEARIYRREGTTYRLVRTLAIPLSGMQDLQAQQAIIWAALDAPVK